MSKNGMMVIVDKLVSGGVDSRLHGTYASRILDFYRQKAMEAELFGLSDEDREELKEGIFALNRDRRFCLNRPCTFGEWLDITGSIINS